ncbi:MAG TPA: OFA family MFS transporter [Candidatus Dormibacteraeota bacterium]|nr:OFA family MFS transporter [Candidatus Dormibacteraeota bacterium]
MAISGAVVMLTIGTVYAWSVFVKPLIAATNWDVTTVSWAFALAIFFLGIGAVIGGRWQDRVGPHTVTLVGVLLWGIGNILAGLGTGSLGAPWLYLTFGVIGGLGNGMAYITPIAMVTKWFPDKRGFASGFVVMGFGLGAFVFAKPILEPLIRNVGVFHTFLFAGIIYLVIGGIAASILKNPPEGYAVPGWTAPAAGTGSAAQYSYTPSEMFGTWQFYVLWLMLFLNVTAGIFVIAQAAPMGVELAGMTAGQAAGLVGLISVFNGLGRFFWGAVSDRIGRRWAYVCIYSVQVVVFLTLDVVHSATAFATLFSIVLLCYGGGFGTMPSFNADYFGTKFMGVNYGWIITAWGVGGLAGPLFGGRIRDLTGSYHGALVPIAIMLLITIVLPLVVRPPQKTAPMGGAVAAS